MRNEEQEALRLAREQIKSKLKETVQTLEEVREKLRMSCLWEYGSTAKTLEQIIEKLKKMEEELPLPTPDISTD